jgi:hypothetical protein
MIKIIIINVLSFLTHHQIHPHVSAKIKEEIASCLNNKLNSPGYEITWSIKHWTIKNNLPYDCPHGKEAKLLVCIEKWLYDHSLVQTSNLIFCPNCHRGHLICHDDKNEDA